MEQHTASGEPVLIDRYKRRIDYLRISVTDRCDLKCLYCMPDGPVPFRNAAELLTLEEIVRIVRVVHRYGLRKVRLTGGEPLLRDDLIPLISTLKRRIGIHDVSLTTNGMRLADLAGKLKEAGLDRVNISLDTMDPGRYRTITRGGDIERVWDALDAAREAGLMPLKINMVPLRGINDDELVNFAALTLDQDCHVRFIERMPIGAGGRDSGRIEKAEMLRRIAVLGRLVPLEFKGMGPSRNYRIEGARGVVGFISAVSDHFCTWCNRLRLTATGRLRPCLFSATDADLGTPLRNGASDEALNTLVEQVVAAKPGGHHLERAFGNPAGFAAMSEIGG